MVRDLRLVRIVTDDEADLRLLRLANEKGKFALSLGTIPDEPIQRAFERGIDAEWFRFVDISPLATVPGRGLFRVFKLTEAGAVRLLDLETQLSEIGE